LYESVDALQDDRDRWLVHYNTERPHRGYRNLGKRPVDTVNAYLALNKMRRRGSSMLIRILTEEDLDALWSIRLRSLQENTEAFGSTFDETLQRGKESLGSACDNHMPPPVSSARLMMSGWWASLPTCGKLEQRASTKATSSACM
jgi:hypothetical protein